MELRKLTSLRFFFALWVFLSHCDFILGEENYVYKRFLQFGYVGVGFFFVLSGFILAYVYKNKIEKGNVSIWMFFKLRFFRLYPLYALTLLLAIPIQAAEDNSSTLPLPVLFTVHATMFQSFLPDEAICFAFNGPAWSVSNEMFFYLLFPLLILYPKRFLLIYIPILTLLIVCNLGHFNHANFYSGFIDDHYFFYINPLYRLIDFLLGVMLFQLYERKRTLPPHTNLVAFAIFVLFFFFIEVVPQQLIYSLYFEIPIALLVVSVARHHDHNILDRMLSSSLIVYLGRMSYGIYLYHILVIRYGDFLVRYAGLKMNGWIYAAVLLAITITVAALSYEWFESPLNKKLRNHFITT